MKCSLQRVAWGWLPRTLPCCFRCWHGCLDSQGSGVFPRHAPFAREGRAAGRDGAETSVHLDEALPGPEANATDVLGELAQSLDHRCWQGLTGGGICGGLLWRADAWDSHCDVRV